MEQGTLFEDMAQPVSQETAVEDSYVIEKPHTDTTEIGKVDGLVHWSKMLRVTNQAERDQALGTGKQCKAYRNQIVGWFADSKKKAHETWKAICAQEKTLTDRLDIIEKNVKAACLQYDQEQAEIRRKEQARLQAEADRRARAERERLEKEAAKLKTPELKQQRLEEAAMVAAPVVELPPEEKADGVITRKTWDAELVSIEDLVAAAAGGNAAALNLLAFDSSKARKFAVATKGQVPIPGVDFVEIVSQAWR